MPYTPPTKWEDCGRDDLFMIPKMIEYGWVPQFAPNDVEHGRTSLNNVPNHDVRFRNKQGEEFVKISSSNAVSFWRLFSGDTRQDWPSLNEYIIVNYVRET